MNELALFAGAGGGILGGKLLGWRTVCAVEIEPYAAGVLIARQNEGFLSPFPVWDDVCTFDGKPWRGRIDVVSGGFPCQDISCAGRGAGISGARSGLWSEYKRIVSEVRPRFVFAENSPALTSRGGVRVIADLAAMGYDCRWGVVSAAHAGASHLRERMWVLASDANQGRLQGGEPWCAGKERRVISEILAACPFPKSIDDISSPRIYGVRNGVADRVDRTKAVGNGQVPAVAALAWHFLSTMNQPTRSAEESNQSITNPQK